MMKRLRQGRWLQLAFALWMLGATGAFYAQWTRLLPLVPRSTIQVGYRPAIVFFSPDSKSLVTVAHDVINYSPYRIDVWDAETATRRFSLEGNDGQVAEVKFSPDGQLLLAGSSQVLTLWYTATGKQCACLHQDEPSPDSNPLRSLLDFRFSPDGRFVLMLTKIDAPNDSIVFWEVATRKVLARIDCPLRGIDWLQFAPDGKQFIVRRFEGKGKWIIERWEFAEDGTPRLMLERKVNCNFVTVSPDLETFITSKTLEPSAEEEIQLWDLSSARPKTRPVRITKTSSFSDMEFNPSGHFLITVHDDKPTTWVVWDTSDGLAEAQVFRYHPYVSPQERWILSTNEGLNGFEVWDAGDHGKQVVAHGPNDKVSWIMQCAGKNDVWFSARARFSPDDRLLITSGMSATYTVNPGRAILTGRWNSRV